MNEATFLAGGDWISTTESSSEVNSARERLASAFGFSSQTWYAAAEDLMEIWKLLSADPNLQQTFEQASGDNEKGVWLDHLTRLRQDAVSQNGPAQDLSEKVDDPPTVEDVPVPKVTEPSPEEPPKEKKSPFGSKPKPQNDAPKQLPVYTGGRPGMVILLEGVLEKDSVQEGVDQIYHNLHHKLGVSYKAGSVSKGKNVLDSDERSGMCETFANVMQSALMQYKNLKANHPTEAVKTGALDFEIDTSLADTRFVTVPNLKLIGSNIAGNIYMEVSGKGQLMNEGYDKIHRYLFTNHWFNRVNGNQYDPLFESVQGAVAITVDKGTNLGDEGSRFLKRLKDPTANGEFSATFVWVHDWATFRATVDEMDELYQKGQKDIDGLINGTLELMEGIINKTPRKAYGEAKALVAKGVAEPDTFMQVLIEAMEDGEFTQEQIIAAQKVIRLAAKEFPDG